MRKNKNVQVGEMVKKETGSRTVYIFVDTEKNINCKSKIISKKQDAVTVYPFYFNNRQKKTLPKYGTIKSLTFEGFNKKIPAGFIKEASKGYGVSKAVKPIIKFIQKHFELNSVILSKKKDTHYLNKELVLKFTDFEKLRKRVASVSRESIEKNNTIINNFFADILKAKFQTKKEKYQRGFIHLIAHQYDGVEQNLSPEDKQTILQLFDTFSKKDNFLEKQQLISTKEKIEKKFIEDVIKKYQRLLKRKGGSEESWQDFFKENSWIFSQLFYCPTVLFKDKAYIGGKTLEDKDGKVVDFLYTNKLTRNSALIEIKKHTTLLLSNKPYRGSDVFSMHKEFSGAISQVLDQKETYTKKFESIRGEDDETKSFNPRCIVVVGMIKHLSKKQLKAFELLRANLKDVDVITFDELYERIEAVLKIFTHNTKDE